MEARRLPREESDELVLGMSAHVAELEAQGLNPVELSRALDALGNPRRIVDDYLAVAGSASKPYKPRAVITAVSCAWLAVLSGLAINPPLLSQFGAEGVIVGVTIAGAVNSLASLVVLITTIVGGMWRRWKDGLSALAFILIAVSTPVLVLGTLTSSDTGGNSSCNVRVSSICIGLPSSPTSIFMRVLLAVVILIVAVCTIHWTRRLMLQSGRILDGGARRWLVVAVSILGLVGAATAVSPVHFTGPGPGKVRVRNDLGETVKITFCPKQECSHQATRRLRDGDHLDFKLRSGDTPDSVVVQDHHGTRCGTLPMADEMSDPAETITGDTRMNLSDNVDTDSCGADVESMDH
jgi:uncharacterized membrane protein